MSYPSAARMASLMKSLMLSPRSDALVNDYSLIKGAAIAINPRHYRKELDNCAVPSKVMEYLTYAKTIISTLSSPIKAVFPTDINWYEGDLKEFLAAHLDASGNLVGLKENHAQGKVEELYGEEKSAQDLRRFLSNF